MTTSYRIEITTTEMGAAVLVIDATTDIILAEQNDLTEEEAADYVTRVLTGKLDLR